VHFQQRAGDPFGGLAPVGSSGSRFEPHCGSGAVVDVVLAAVVVGVEACPPERCPLAVVGGEAEGLDVLQAAVRQPAAIAPIAARSNLRACWRILTACPSSLTQPLELLVGGMAEG